MPPADPRGVLSLVVLRVVDEQPGVCGELEAGRPLRVLREVDRAQRRLVIGQVGERRAALAEPVPDRRARVTDLRSADLELADLETRDAHDVVELEPAR